MTTDQRSNARAHVSDPPPVPVTALEPAHRRNASKADPLPVPVDSGPYASLTPHPNPRTREAAGQAYRLARLGAEALC